MLFNPISIELFLDNKNVIGQKYCFKKTEFQSTRILLSLKLNDNLKNILKREKLLTGDMFFVNKKLYIFNQRIRAIHKPEDVGLLDGFTFYELTNITNYSFPHLKEDVVYKKLNAHKDDSLLYALDKGEDINLNYIGNIYFDFTSIVERIAFEYKKNNQLIDNNLLYYMALFNTYKNKLEFFMNNERCNIRYYEKKDNFRKLHEDLVNKEYYCFKMYIPELKKVIFSSSFMKMDKNKLLFFGFNDYGQIDFFEESFPKGLVYVEKENLPTYHINSQAKIITMFDKNEYHEEVLELIRN